MSTAKASSRRTKKKAVRAPETPPEAAKPRWPMEERKLDPDAPYFGLFKEEFERLAFWRKVPLGPEMEQFIDWFLANHERMRAETIEYSDGRPMNFIPYDGEPFDTGAFWRLWRRDRAAELMAIQFSPPLLCLHVAAELIYGAKWASSEARLLDTHRSIASYELLVPGPATAEIYPDLRVVARRAGKKMPDPDFWIAAHAVENHLPLVSMDRHFTIFDGLNLHLLG